MSCRMRVRTLLRFRCAVDEDCEIAQSSVCSLDGVSQRCKVECPAQCGRRMTSSPTTLRRALDLTSLGHTVQATYRTLCDLTILVHCATKPQQCPNSHSARHSWAQSTRAPSSSPPTTSQTRAPTQQPAW